MIQLFACNEGKPIQSHPICENYQLLMTTIFLGPIFRELSVKKWHLPFIYPILDQTYIKKKKKIKITIFSFTLPE